MLQKCLDKERDWAMLKHTLKPTEDSSEVDFVLHWKQEKSNRQGFFTSFRQPLSQSGQKRLVQIAFNHRKSICSATFPLNIALELSITPLVPIHQVRLSAKR